MSDEQYRETRYRVAEKLRRLGNALVGHRPPVEVLDTIGEMADRLIPQVEEAPPRPPPLEFLSEPDIREALTNGDVSRLLARAANTSMFDDSVVSGGANPMGLGVDYHRDEQGTLARVVLGPAFEGAPGRAHGGVVAAIFDETMGAVLPEAGTLAFTGTLTITYRAPAPIGEPLEFRAWIASREGRKIRIAAQGTTGGAVFAEADAVFVAVADLTATPP